MRRGENVERDDSGEMTDAGRLAVDAMVCQCTSRYVVVITNEGDGASKSLGESRLDHQLNQALTDHLRLALDAARLGTWRWDMATGAVTWDARMEELFGFAPGGFDGTFDAYQAALHPDDREEVLATVRHATETNTAYRVEHRVVGADGSMRWIQGAGRPTVDELGQVNGAIGCSMDVTDRVEAQLAAEAAARRAQEAAERERIDRERLELLSAIHEALAESATRDEIMVAVTRAAVPALGDWCTIVVLPDDGGREPAIETFPLDEGLARRVQELATHHPYDPDAPFGIAAAIRTGQPEFYPEITPQLLDESLANAGYDAPGTAARRAAFEALELRSVICVPLMKHGRILGGLSFANTTSRRAFTELDLELAEVVAGRVASSIENRRLADAQRRIASTLQASLLPSRLPDVPGLDVAVRYWAAGEGTEVGGDFYDVFSVDDHRWAVVIGDVCGTGPEAAAVTALARHTIRNASWRGDSPIELLSWLNHAMLQTFDPGASFLTVAFATIEALGEELAVTITHAGHPPAVLVRASGSAEAVGAHGRLIGMFDEVMATPFDFIFRKGDTLVLYTDGLTDVPPPHALTTDEVVELVAATSSGASSADAVAGRIESAIEHRLRLQHRPDDIAVVVLRAC